MYKIFVKKANASYEIDFEALPEVSQKRVIVYGLTQLLSDAAAQVATTASVDGRRIPLKGPDLAKAIVSAKAEADQRLSDLMEGIVRRTRESSVDPIEAEARRIAINVVRKDADFLKHIASRGWKATDREAVEELSKRAAPLASSDKVRAIAERRIAEMEDLDV